MLQLYSSNNTTLMYYFGRDRVTKVNKAEEVTWNKNKIEEVILKINKRENGGGVYIRPKINYNELLHKNIVYFGDIFCTVNCNVFLNANSSCLTYQVMSFKNVEKIKERLPIFLLPTNWRLLFERIRSNSLIFVSKS